MIQNRLTGWNKRSQHPAQPLPADQGGAQPLPLQECWGVLEFMERIQSCAALQSRAESDAASRIVAWLGLPSHHDPQKNWDTLKCLHYILALNDPAAPVLDAGASGKSKILQWLSLLGYPQLYACDIREKSVDAYAKRNVQFSVQDLTRTNYPDAFFQAITSISVIEHGVPLDRYVREMARVLRPGGLLLTSTDYWSEPVDCRGIYPYGEEMGEMKVFQRGEIEDFCALAEKSGFALCRPLDLDTRERVIRWDRVDREYTFAFVALRKVR
jgi:SAM-dependent methyltransferase